MSEQNQQPEDETLPSPEEIRQLFGSTVGLKTQLKRAKDYTNTKTDHIKLGKAYTIMYSKDEVFFVNAIVLNPQSAVPMGMGFKITPTDYQPFTIDLALLGKEFIF